LPQDHPDLENRHRAQHPDAVGDDVGDNQIRSIRFRGINYGILGGIVAAGSKTSTLRQVRGDMRAAEQLQNKLIDRLKVPS
jgi:hypothetical protein